MRVSVLVALAGATLSFGGDFSQRFEIIKHEASPHELYSFLYALPKGGDIHHHLGLSFRVEDMWAGATDASVTRGNDFYTRLSVTGCKGDTMLPLRFLNIDRSTYSKLDDCGQKEFKSLSTLSKQERDDWMSSLIIDKPGEGRNEFFEVIVNRAAGLLRNPYFIGDQVTRMLARYKKENIRYVESQAAPAYEQLSVLRTMLQGAATGETGVEMRLQAVIIRFLPDAEQKLEQAYQFVDANRDLFVGINMAGREDDDKGHALRFADTFQKMRRKYSGIHLSIHGGEKDSPGPEVRNTLRLGAERIGHAVNLIYDPDTMMVMRNGHNLVESSLVSNELLEYTPDVSKHPFVEYLRFGVPVCLNTDDSGVWDSQMTDDYYLAVRHFNLSWEEVVRIGRNSLQYSFAEPALKQKLLKSYNMALEEFERKYDANDWRTTLHGVTPAVSGYAHRKLGM